MINLSVFEKVEDSRRLQKTLEDSKRLLKTTKQFFFTTATKQVTWSLIHDSAAEEEEEGESNRI